MQDFNADCTINLLLGAQGQPAKLVWVCSLTRKDGTHLLSARKFFGIGLRERAEWEAALFGLRQAAQLQQEKVAFAFDASLAGINRNDVGRLRDPALQSLREEAEALWTGFRLRKAARLDGKEAAFLREEAARAFRRPRERNRT